MEDTMLINRMNEIETLILQLQRDVRESKTKENNSFPIQTYYTLKEAVILKFGSSTSYTTVSTNYCLMPCGNSHFEVIAGVRRWKREYILEWLDITDKDIIPYLAKYQVPLKGRFAEKYKKYIKKEDSV